MSADGWPWAVGTVGLSDDVVRGLEFVPITRLVMLFAADAAGLGVWS